MITQTALLTGALLFGFAQNHTPHLFPWERPEKPESPQVVMALKEVEPQTKYVCEKCTPSEKLALDHFQKLGVTDRNALATILGNIQQESRFIPNICEGGARIPYEKCHRGGYGLIQWTTALRYRGLGNHSKNIGKSPSSLEAQLSYISQEPQWKRAMKRFQQPGLSINSYMQGAYWWLGWGIHGNRTAYAQDYAAMISVRK